MGFNGFNGVSRYGHVRAVSRGGVDVIPSGIKVADRKLVSPGPFDEEFENEAINPVWQITSNTYGYSDINYTVPSCFYGVPSAASQNIALAMSYAPAGAFSITFAIDGRWEESYDQIDIGAQTASGADAVHSTFQFSGAQGTKIALYTRDSSVNTYDRKVYIVYSGKYAGRAYIHLQRDDSNNWISAVSFDGYGWLIAGGGSYAKTMTVSQITVLVDFANAAPFKGNALIDWIRVNWLTL